MKDYNKLTKRLLEDGYTADNHPDYVYVSRERFSSNDPLDNFHGGFVYYYWHVAERVYKTPCGMQCRGRNTLTGASWMGTDWNHENDCPFIICPKGVTDCGQRAEPFRSHGTGVLYKHCALSPTDEEYRYEGSCEAERHLYDDRLRREKLSFIMQRKGRVCENHMRYDDREKKWVFRYDPMICARGFCRAKTSFDEDGGFCPVIGRALSKQKGNVFYDVKYSGRDYSKDGTLFEGERFERIIKGRQLFSKPILLDIAKLVANMCKDSIMFQTRWNNSDYGYLTLYRAERGEIDFQWEVQNIRAEKRETRDLEQDLEDIANGITVTHELDKKKAKQQMKKANREASRQKRIKRIEKLIIRNGFENLEWIDQNRACKLLDSDRIDELDAVHYESVEAEKNAPVQMTLADFMKGAGHGFY